MVKIGRLSDEITKQLRMYSQYTNEEVRKITEEVSKETVLMIKRNVEKVGFVKTKDYRNGWTLKRQGGKFYIHNKTDYQLTHLLEKGHALRNGDRVSGKPHIGPAEEWMETEFEARIIRRLKE